MCRRAGFLLCGEGHTVNSPHAVESWLLCMIAKSVVHCCRAGVTSTYTFWTLWWYVHMITHVSSSQECVSLVRKVVGRRPAIHPDSSVVFSFIHVYVCVFRGNSRREVGRVRCIHRVRTLLGCVVAAAVFVPWLAFSIFYLLLSTPTTDCSRGYTHMHNSHDAWKYDRYQGDSAAAVCVQIRMYGLCDDAT